MPARIRTVAAVVCALFGAALIMTIASGEGTGVWGPKGAAIYNDYGVQQYPVIAPDGTGGAIVAWEDHRYLTDTNIYARRVHANGTVAWQADGVEVCTVEGNQEYPEIVSDGSGGAIIVWMDYRSTGGSGIDILAQRVNASGSVLWAAGGLTICGASYNQGRYRITPDGSGGAIIVWEDERNTGTTAHDIFAQRVNASGVVQWATDGVTVCASLERQGEPEIVTDGAGGAIIVWEDYRYGSTDVDIYAQRVLSNGTMAWTGNGLDIAWHTSNQKRPQITEDGAGGAIIVWEDYYHSGGSYPDLYSQRLNGSGADQWTENGEAVCTQAANKKHPRIASDGAGGAIIAWEDYRYGTSDIDIYAQHVNSDGSMNWTANGLDIGFRTYNQKHPQITQDGSGGAVIVWEEYYYTGGSYADLYAQRVDSDGQSLWESEGIAACASPSDQKEHRLCSNQPGGAIAAWTDWAYYGTSETTIYAQKLGQAVSLPLVAKRE